MNVNASQSSRNREREEGKEKDDESTSSSHEGIEDDNSSSSWGSSSSDDSCSSSSSSPSALHYQPVPFLRRRASSPSLLPNHDHQNTSSSSSSPHRRIHHTESEDQKKRQHGRCRRKLTLLCRRLTRDHAATHFDRFDRFMSGCATVILGTSCILWIILLFLPTDISWYRSQHDHHHYSPSRHRQPLDTSRSMLRTTTTTTITTQRDFDSSPAMSPKGAVKRIIRNMAEHIVAFMEETPTKTLPYSPFERKKQKFKSPTSSEALKPGCVRPDWQLHAYSTPLEIHEIDLPAILYNEHPIHTTDESSPPVGFLSRGLWRSVWVAYPRDATLPTVLKMMKMEHPVDQRNLDRHMRDAIVMERLSASPYVTDMYAFVGNTIVTEYLPKTLDQVIYKDAARMDGSPALVHGRTRRGDKRLFKNQTATSMTNTTTGIIDWNSTLTAATTTDTVATRLTPRGRLQLAIDVVKGIQALHTIKGGPIVHADLQAKQFLVAADGSIKINDFNRCRFMAHTENATRMTMTHSRITTAAEAKPCHFRIPSAPGKHRAPEEYANEELNEKLDIYSTAHVLYGILSGDDPWRGWTSAEVKRVVQAGYRPLVAPQHLVEGTSDERLHNLTLRAYELDPSKRISAAELVQELEQLLVL